MICHVGCDGTQAVPSPPASQACCHVSDVKIIHCSSFSSAVFALSIRWWVTSSWWVVVSDFIRCCTGSVLGELCFCFGEDVWQFYCISWSVLSRNKSLHFSHLHIILMTVWILALHKNDWVQFCFWGMFLKCKAIGFRKLLKIYV